MKYRMCRHRGVGKNVNIMNQFPRTNGDGHTEKTEERTNVEMNGRGTN